MVIVCFWSAAPKTNDHPINAGQESCLAESSGSLSGSGESWIGRGSQALQRGIGVWGAAGVGVACIGLNSTGMLPFLLMAGMWPGMNLIYSILVGLVSLAYLMILLAGTLLIPGWVKPVQLSDILIFGIVLAAGLASYWIWRSHLRAKGSCLEDDLKSSPR